MGWTVPDEGEGTYDGQSTLYQESLDVLVAGIARSDFVVFGCAVTGGASMSPNIAKGGVIANGVLLPVAATSTVIGSAHLTNPRIDLIVVDASGAVQTRAGTAAVAPKPPARTAHDVVLAMVYVGPSVTTIPTALITDQRVICDNGITLKRTTTPVVKNTTAAAETFFTIVLPSGLLVAGRQIEVFLGGDYLINSGSPTLTFSVDYGGTTFFLDATAAFTASANRGAWSAHLLLSASANAVQQLVGEVRVQTPGAKTAPTNGEGDLAVVTHIDAPIYGAGTVDSDAADRTLNVKWTMSVSNVADEVTGVGYARLI